MRNPVILLAFANDREDSSRFLSELHEEQLELDDLLSSHLNVEQKPVATLKRIQQAFNTYGKDIRIFHFAGHANAEQIELAMGKDGHKGGYVKGVANYIGLQKGVELVFLNGCSTKEQVDYFFNAGIPAMIATTSPVNDKVAREFATLFYHEFVLSQGDDQKNKAKNLREAFEGAKAQLLGRYQKPEQLYTRGFRVENPEIFPYELHTKSVRGESLRFEDLFLDEAEEETKTVHPKAHLLCDRDDASEGFLDTVKDHLLDKAQHPLVAVVHGEEQELPLKLCQRFYDFTVKKTFKSLDIVLDESLYERFEIETPREKDFRKAHKAMDRIKESFKYKLSMDHIPARDIRSMDGQAVIDHIVDEYAHLKVVIFQHNLYAVEWKHDSCSSFFEEYLDQFWRVTFPEKTPDILLLFSVQYKPPKGLIERLKGRDGRMLDGLRAQETQVLDELLAVPRIDVRKWNDKYAPDDPDMTDKLYGKKDKLSMSVLLPVLKAAVDKRRR